MPERQSSEQREEGCLETLKKEFPQIEILSSTEYAGDSADKALVKSQQLLLSFGDRLDGVFTPAQHVSTGMLRALEEQGLAGKVKFVGLDAGPELVQALRTGKMHGIVLRDIRKAVVTDFPYVVYYRVELTRVIVIAVIHGNRDPA